MFLGEKQPPWTKNQTKLYQNRLTESDIKGGEGRNANAPQVISLGHFSAKWQDQEEKFWNWFLRLSEKGGWNEY